MARKKKGKRVWCKHHNGYGPSPLRNWNVVIGFAAIVIRRSRNSNLFIDNIIRSKINLTVRQWLVLVIRWGYG